MITNYKFATIIVNYKSENKTISFVKNELSKCTLSQIIIIVNNKATIESSNMMARELFGDVIYDITFNICNKSNLFIIHNEENLGFAKGNNLGVNFLNNHFKVDYLLFSNNDIVLKDSDTIERMIEKIDELPQSGIIGPKIIGTNGDFQNPYNYVSFWTEMIGYYWERFIPFYHIKHLNRETAKEGNYYRVMGAFFIARYIDFLNCGMMDPNTFLFYEEPILSERMLHINKTTYYFPDVCVVHEHGSTINNSDNTSDIYNHLFKSGIYYFKHYKNISSLSIFLAKASNYTYNTMKLLKNKLSISFIK